MAFRQKLTGACFFVCLVLFHDVSAQSLQLQTEGNGYSGIAIGFGILLSILGINIYKNRRLIRQNRRLRAQIATSSIELERTKQGANEIREEASAAALTKSQFLATMSHEIRTPMNGVLGMAELLSNENLLPEHRNYVDIILKSGESLLSIINDILDFSKIESGKLELDKYPLNLVDCAEEVLSLLSAKIDQKPIELLYEIEEGLPEDVITDGLRLRQILLNLAGNAP